MSKRAVLPAIAVHANGDARSALNLLELTASVVPDGEPRVVTREHLAPLVARRTLRYDKDGEEHYNLISALHKSLRNSNPDAAVYWLARMLDSGEDLMYVARRLVRFASEDVGNADPQALVVSIAAQQAAHLLGLPEANTALAQAAVYLATAPKSNAVYVAYNEAAEAARRDEADAVPLHLRNAPTRLMKQLEYGKGYEYAHDARGGGHWHGLPATGAAGAAVLSTDRSRLREGAGPQAGGLAGNQEEDAERRTMNVERTRPGAARRTCRQRRRAASLARVRPLRGQTKCRSVAAPTGETRTEQADTEERQRSRLGYVGLGLWLELVHAAAFQRTARRKRQVERQRHGKRPQVGVRQWQAIHC